LKPYVSDCIIISERINLDYKNSVALYRNYLIKFALELLQKYPNMDYLLIGSGLDDALKERKQLANKISQKGYQITELNNDINTISDARDIFGLYSYLQEEGYKIPNTKPLHDFDIDCFSRDFPLVLKKKSSSGGINIYKLDTPEEFRYRLKLLRETDIAKEWMVQEYIKGIPASCTVISNGNESEIVSVNRQIIGLQLLNPPKEFIYCGNVVPGRILREDKNKIMEISRKLTDKLGLKGINGFDFVIKNHYPYLMEINPRIPGSIRASEESLRINLLEQHINSFQAQRWEQITKIINTHRETLDTYTTKLIYFAPKDIKIDLIPIINKLDYIHDQSPKGEQIQKGAPVCSILYSAETFSKSYFNALKIANNINELVN